MWSKNKKENRAIWRWVIFYSLVMVVYAVWSYGLVVPNLWLSSWSGFVAWQEWIWSVFRENRELTTLMWLAMTILMWVGAVGLGRQVNRVMVGEKGKKAPQAIWNWKKVLILLAIVAGPLVFSYNALSADVFNYIFNAKMVINYGADPHVQVATDFPEDEMVRFMHNSHTAAPYGYVWTGISLPVWLVSGGRFILAWLGMRGMAVVSLVILSGLLWWGWRKKITWANPILVLLCPLLLIETISNNHNDLWMMVATMASFWLIWDKKNRSWWRILLSALVMGLGTQIKLASLVAIPFWLYLVCIKDWLNGAWYKQWLNWNWLNVFKRWVEKYFFDLLVLCFFVPLLTDRSQQFHPWYWSWCLVWLPFCRLNWVRVGLLALAASSMLRYIPFLWAGYYDAGILWQQKLVTFVGGGVIWAGVMLWEKWKKSVI